MNTIEAAKMFLELSELNSTVFEHNGVTIKTTDDPHVSDDGQFYEARGVDNFGNFYEIEWRVIDEEATDESEACDWNSPAKVTPIFY